MDMKESTQAFHDLFSGGKEDVASILDGYMYMKWLNLYIYNIRSIAQAFNPDPDVKLRYPEEMATPEADELTYMAAGKLLPVLMSPETSTYHSKVVKLDDAKSLVKIDRDISITDTETVIPYKLARDIIIKNPDSITVFECPCRKTKENPCEPLDVCMFVGEPFASFLLEHETNNPRKISQDEAVNILKAEDDRGHLHTAWFKESLGGRFYAICNCCGCCCAAMRGHFANVPLIASSGYISEVNEECNGCEECVEYCHFGAIRVEDRALINYEKCMGCGVCEPKCPVDAISLKRDPAKGEPLDIKVLMENA